MSCFYFNKQKIKVTSLAVNKRIHFAGMQLRNKRGKKLAISSYATPQ